jgi:hypothetical protein
MLPVAEALEATSFFDSSEEIDPRVNGHLAAIQEFPPSPAARSE